MTATTPPDMATDETETPTLLRAIGPWQMILYGAGSMMGAGIYGLIGKAAGQVGSAVWLSFLAALTAALFTGLSYAALGSRYPRAGGAAFMTHHAFGHPLLTHVVGLATVFSGLTSIAAGARVVGENLQRVPVLETVSVTLLALVYLLIMAGIVYRGIRESLWVNLVCTLVEAGGLLLIIAVGARFWGSADLLELPPAPAGGSAIFGPLLIVQGAALTFFAFVGFEDALNVAEEVKEPHINLPLGILGAMLITAVIYIGVAITAVSVIPWQTLGQSKAPLADVMKIAAPWFPAWSFIVITIFAVANTALVNFITASRLLYGMARDGRLPAPLAQIHPGRRTPYVAVAVLLAVLVVLVLSGGVTQLAEATVLLLLCVFVIVNGAYLVLKGRRDETKGAFEPPAIIPVLGLLTCLALLGVRLSTGDWRAPAIAGAMIVVALVLYPLTRSSAAKAPA
jgi:APA family basic amino acid/polyamine antiporter